MSDPVSDPLPDQPVPTVHVQQDGRVIWLTINNPPLNILDITTIQQLGYDYESGRITDLKAGLKKAAAQIDTDIAQAK
jgi:enoyl-CoA hydratase/carnithine racemase